MRRLIVSLDGLPALRAATGSAELDLAAAATLAELAGVDTVRLSLNEDLRPVREPDVQEARRAARRLELRMPPRQSLLKVVLEARPDRVLLSDDPQGGGFRPMVRAVVEGGVPVAALVPPGTDAVKRAHQQGVPAVEFQTRTIVDLPAAERRAELERLSDGVRLASKLGLGIGIGGGLGYRSLPELLEACPAVESVAVGRAALARALLVGLDRALRDLRALLA